MKMDSIIVLCVLNITRSKCSSTLFRKLSSVAGHRVQATSMLSRGVKYVLVGNVKVNNLQSCSIYYGGLELK